MKNTRQRPFYYRPTCNIVAPCYDLGFRLVSLLVGGEERIRNFTLERLDIFPRAWVLEFCCGTGTLSIMASRLKAQVVGIDLAENMVALARQKAKKSGVEARFLLADATRIPFPDQHFDRVFVSFALHELPQVCLIKGVLYEMKRLLKKGGKGLIIDYHQGDGLPKLLLMGFLRLAESQRAQPLIELDLSQLVSDMGFGNIQKETLGRGVLQLITFER